MAIIIMWVAESHKMVLNILLITNVLLAELKPGS